jgi:hypothetical protein
VSQGKLELSVNPHGLIRVGAIKCHVGLRLRDPIDAPEWTLIAVRWKGPADQIGNERRAIDPGPACHLPASDVDGLARPCHRSCPVEDDPSSVAPRHAVFTRPDREVTYRRTHQPQTLSGEFEGPVEECSADGLSGFSGRGDRKEHCWWTGRRRLSACRRDGQEGRAEQDAPEVCAVATVRPSTS